MSQSAFISLMPQHNMFINTPSFINHIVLDTNQTKKTNKYFRISLRTIFFCFFFVCVFVLYMRRNLPDNRRYLLDDMRYLLDDRRYLLDDRRHL